MNTLINRILNIIAQNNIQNYLVSQTVTSSEELFYIKKSLQQSRCKNTTKCDVTIYHDFEHNDMPMRGSSSFIADASMTDDELNSKIVSAYNSALSVKNPYYKLPMAQQIFTEADNIFHQSLEDVKIYSAFDIAEMLFKNDTNSDAFINSAEIFVTTQNVHIINSNGINVTYSDIIYSGEYVVQTIQPNDVELYYDFKYSYLDKNIAYALETKLNNSLSCIRDRAIAKSISNDNIKMNYENIILEGNTVYELFYYYIRRLDSSMIYPEYSKFSINNSVILQSDAYDSSSSDCKNDCSDSINISLNPKKPYSPEGIPLINAALIKDNIAKLITGNSQFSYYLGIPAIGTYTSYKMECGKTSMSKMESKPYLKIVNFSDFQMNELTGQFGGEFRLAYYFDGEKVTPVTNSSISGNINDLVKSMVLSSESQVSYNFEGPLAVSYSV